MYGTIFRMKPVAGKEQNVIDIFKEWGIDRKPNVEGVFGGYVMKPDADNGDLVAIAVFESKEAYLANGNDPDQHKWFMRLRELLQSDPSWEDGEFIGV